MKYKSKSQSEINSILESYENILCLLPVEGSIVINENGDVISIKIGSIGEIGYSKTELDQMKNCYFTHNHPIAGLYRYDERGNLDNFGDISPCPFTLSDNDIYVACRGKLKELRGIDRFYRYTLKALNGSFNEEIYSEFTEKLKRHSSNWKKFTSTDLLFNDDYDRYYRTLSEIQGISYIKEPWKPRKSFSDEDVRNSMRIILNESLYEPY